MSVLAAPLERALRRELDSPVMEASPVAGGDVNEAYRLTLASGAVVFLKTRSGGPHDLFTKEARGLDWLRVSGAPHVPAVRAAAEAEGDAPGFLVLDYVRTTTRAADFDEALGRRLAALHRSRAPSFGLDHDNYIGTLAQANHPRPTWAEFYREGRLAPQLRLARDAGRATPAMSRGFERLFAALEGLVGTDEPPCRLHGDLWSGNVIADDRGQPCLVDPAVYGGHREVDLAMMRLFGGFATRTFDAYEEVFPTAPGAAARVDLYQLYPLMVHVNLFGGSYTTSVEHLLGRLV